MGQELVQHMFLEHFPSMKSLFHKFYTIYLRKFCKETSWNISSIDPGIENTRVPHDWWKLGMHELEAWL